MTLRALFHVSPLSAPREPQRPRMPSFVEVEVEYQEERPRGRSHETWARARGWASED